MSELHPSHFKLATALHRKLKINWRRSMLQTALLLGFSSQSHAAVGIEAVLPPQDLIQQSILQHPSVLTMRSEQDYATMQRQGLKQGDAAWQFQLGMQLRQTDAQAEQKQSNSYEPNIALEKQLRLPSKYRLDQELGQRGLSMAELKYQDAKHEVAEALINDWYSLMRSALELTRVAAHRDQIQHYMQMTEQRVRAGDAPRLELMLLNNESRQADVLYLQAQALYTQAQQSLARDYVGELPQQFNRDAIVVNPKYTAQPSEQWLAQITAVDHALALAQMQSEQQHALLKRSQLNRLPDPTIGVGYSREQAGEENVIGFSVSIPLDAAQVRVASGMAAAEAAKADVAVLQMKKMLHREVLGWTTQMQLAMQSSTYAQQNLEQLQQQHHLMQKAYRLGEFNLNELLLHAQQLNEAQRVLDQSLVDYAHNLSILLLRSHQLWPLHQ